MSAADREAGARRRTSLSDLRRVPMPARARLGLRSRIAALVTGAVVVLASLAGAGIVEREGSQARADARLRAGALLETLAVPCAVALIKGDLAALDGYLGELTGPGSAGLGVRWVAMVDHEGVIRAQSGAGGQEARGDLAEWLARAADAEEPRWRQLGGALDVSMPAVVGLRWGTLVGSFDLSPFEVRLRERRGLVVLTIVGLVLLLVLLVYFAVDRAVLRRLAGLGSAAEAIQGGDLGARAQVGPGDELGRLASTFNAMASELQTQTAALEERVAARTDEVERKNEELADVNQKLAAVVQELERLALTDELTGLLNRRAFRERLGLESRRSARTGQAFGLLALDLDHFKRVNDTWGHPTGDRVLSELASLLEHHLRSTDLVARTGGEEFSVLLLDTDEEATMRVAEKLRSRVREHLFRDVEGQPIGRLTVSVGVAIRPQHGDDEELLVRRADAALYVAKEAGRDRVVVAEAVRPDPG